MHAFDVLAIPQFRGHNFVDTTLICLEIAPWRSVGGLPAEDQERSMRLAMEAVISRD